MMMMMKYDGGWFRRLADSGYCSVSHIYCVCGIMFDGGGVYGEQ